MNLCFSFPVGTIALLLNQTRDMVPKFEFNTTTFIAENDRLIGEIDDIISGLSDIHRRLNRVTDFSCSLLNISDIRNKGVVVKMRQRSENVSKLSHL